MIKEAIILAGGLGTRLRSVVADIPKCIAPIHGKPFLHYLLENLKTKELFRGLNLMIDGCGLTNSMLLLTQSFELEEAQV